MTVRVKPILLFKQTRVPSDPSVLVHQRTKCLWQETQTLMLTIWTLTRRFCIPLGTHKKIPLLLLQPIICLSLRTFFDRGYHIIQKLTTFIYLGSNNLLCNFFQSSQTCIFCRIIFNICELSFLHIASLSLLFFSKKYVF